VATSENPSWTASGFGDGNQTRLSNLNQDKDVILGKRKCHFYGDMDVGRILEILLSWSYGSCKYFGIFPNRFMERGECPNPTRLT